jgi:hypothetical protein
MSSTLILDLASRLWQDNPMDRLDKLVMWLGEQSGNYVRIAAACKVKQRWVHLVAIGKIKEPGWRKTEKLLRYMEAQQMMERRKWEL